MPTLLGYPIIEWVIGLILFLIFTPVVFYIECKIERYFKNKSKNHK